jgi:hypothetical protein
MMSQTPRTWQLHKSLRKMGVHYFKTQSQLNDLVNRITKNNGYTPQVGFTERAATRHDTIMLEVNQLGGHNAVRHGHHQQYGKSAHSAQRTPLISQQLHHPLSSKRPTRQLYKVLPPPLDMSEAAAAPAVATIPVECPGFDRCSSLQHYVSKDYKRRQWFDLSNWSIGVEANRGTHGARYSQNAVTAETTSL